MAVFGIVSEFNPFHHGHEYLISCARKMGADAVVCAMSGNATQRGELAIFDKYPRAETAVSGGADLVLELPFPWSSASAERFALAGVYILSFFCDTVLFGSECGDIEFLTRVAEFTSSEKFKESYAELLSNGEKSAAAYASLVECELGGSLSSNDLLGVEYIKAAKTLGLDIRFMTVKRQGSAYLSDKVSEGGFDSAMAIRNALSEENFAEKLSGRLPIRSFELLCEAKNKGKTVNSSKYGDSARMFFRLLDSDAAFAECEGGVLERICRVAHESHDVGEFWDMLSTKRYTDAKLRRAVLFAMCGVKRDDLLDLPAYTSLLAANKCGRQLLSDKRRTDALHVVTKPADACELCENGAKRQGELDARLASIYNFCLESSAPTGESLRKKPYIT